MSPDISARLDSRQLGNIVGKSLPERESCHTISALCQSPVSSVILLENVTREREGCLTMSGICQSSDSSVILLKDC